MRMEPDPEIATLVFSEKDKIHRVDVRGENVFEFSMSERWYISVVIVSKDRNTLTITVKRSEDATD